MKIKEFIEHKRIREALDESRPINFVEYDPDIIGAITGQAEPAAKLLQIRERLGLSQTEIVERLGLQTDHTLISMYEHNKRQPPLNVLLAYARIAGVPLEQIVDDNLELTLPEILKA